MCFTHYLTFIKSSSFTLSMKCCEVMDVFKVKCPICGDFVDMPDDVVSGEVIEHSCGVTLEVIMEDGEVKLKPFEGVGEDWGE